MFGIFLEWNLKMKLDFSRGKVTLVICPVDMRSGIDRLSQTARQVLGIDILQGNRFVVFISRSMSILNSHEI